MATYQELLQAMEDPTLNVRVRAAILVAADTIRAEDPQTANHAVRVDWVRKNLLQLESLPLIRSIIVQAVVQNRTSTLTQITTANDAAVQTAVNNVITMLALADL